MSYFLNKNMERVTIPECFIPFNELIQFKIIKKYKISYYIKYSNIFFSLKKRAIIFVYMIY